MASVSLFAPQVQPIQPVFINESGGNLRINFSFSSYNKKTDISAILLTLINPNQSSSWGNNSMVSSGSTGYLYAPARSVSVDGNNAAISFSLTNFKNFVNNQYYQAQLFLVEKDISAPEDNIVTTNWLNNNKDSISVGSQATLIRSIAKPNISLNRVTIEGTPQKISSFPYLTGSIADPIETLDNYYCKIYNSDDLLLYTSATVLGNGRLISIPINYTLDSGTYKGKFYYTTVHGYSNFINFSFGLLKPTVSLDYKITSLSFAQYGIKITYNANASSSLQRMQEGSNFWETIAEVPSGSSKTFYDYTATPGLKYQYRLINSSSVSNLSAFIQYELDDIIIIDKDLLFVVAYNPNISNIKKVTQESITNTLGGKYPIIRKNGDTAYTQFTLSGIVSGEFPSDTTSGATDSTKRTGVLSIPSAENYILPKESNPLNIPSTTSDAKVRTAMETKIRQYIIDSLENGEIKIFKSPEEKSMIVYLSNLSFTPNKQLGRHIYDFSATVTEVCEYSIENLTKYGLNNLHYQPNIRG